MALKKLVDFKIYRKFGKKSKVVYKELPARSIKQAVACYFYIILKGKKNRGSISEYYAVEVEKKPDDISYYEFGDVTCQICGYADPAGPGHNCPNCGNKI